MSLRVLVTGGRDFADALCVARTLETLHEKIGIAVLIHGDAAGADRLSSMWAVGAGVKQAAYPAVWKVYGRAAGHIRNQQMLTEGKPDIVVAFPGGRGTADMVSRAARAGLRILHVEPHG